MVLVDGTQVGGGGSKCLYPLTHRASSFQMLLSYENAAQFLPNTETSEKLQGSGILQLFANLLTPQSSCTAKVANIIAEAAKNEFMRIPCVEAGLISPLVQLLNSKDQEVLLQMGRALGNICYDSRITKNSHSVAVIDISNFIAACSVDMGKDARQRFRKLF
ncbi:hypothetical protein STEG23_036119 [Scotinomys teguina]